MPVTITNGKLSASVYPKGAELFSLKHNDTEYIWEGDPDFWGKHSPVLFPIVGTLKNGAFTINEVPYNLSRHGFARDNEFSIKHTEDNKVVFSLLSSETTKKMFPFDFELEIIYTLNDENLEIEYIVHNNGDTPMPFSLGAHPAFALPGNFEDYSLKFEKEEPLQSIQLVNDLLSDITLEIPAPNGILPLQQSLFLNDALIFKSLESRAITILKNGVDYLKVNYPLFPHLGVWTKPGAKFICIEPWQGYSDSNDVTGNLYEKEGVLVLYPGKNYTVGFTIIIP